MLAQSIRPTRARWSVSASTRRSLATARARSPSTSTTATSSAPAWAAYFSAWNLPRYPTPTRSEEHTSELQSHSDLHSFPTRRSSDLVVMVGRDGNARAVDPSDEGAVVGQRIDAQIARDRARALPVDVDDRDQLRPGMGGVLLGVELAEVPDPDEIGRAHV